MERRTGYPRTRVDVFMVALREMDRMARDYIGLVDDLVNAAAGGGGAPASCGAAHSNGERILAAEAARNVAKAPAGVLMKRRREAAESPA